MGLEGMVSKRRGSPYGSGPSDSWVKTKSWEIGEFDLLGVKREPGKPPMALMARGGKYAGSAFISADRSIKERLWKRVQQARAEQPSGVPNAVAGPTVEWLKPGIKARVKHLRGEEDLRHASLQDFREET